MVDGVADEVEQRLLDLGGDAAVELRLLAGDRHLDLASERVRERASVPGQRLQERAQRLHLQRLELLHLPLGGALEAPLTLVELARDVLQRLCQALQHLFGVRVIGALGCEAREAGEPADEVPGAGGEDAHPRGAVGEGVERGGVDPDLGGVTSGLGTRRFQLARRCGLAVRGRRRLATARHLLHHRRERVDRVRERLGRTAVGELQPALGAVTEVGDRRQPEHAPRALDRVELAPCLGGGARIAGHAPRQRRQPLEACARLADEQRHEVGKLSVHGRKAVGRG